ncbi:glucans biosynthesis glucosyltransferase MdoH [Hyphomicrobium sp. 99]|uniref:glucans biosynthesis glucosyltransferase MdoH n=1 Tax=Hyphomicrobium sp. 99 TaxID=1163419 RepID=UPI0005F8007E|nr:glucans biosynthesis glucosyltransferase MdoH [Hyphomicrobium sp. 99]
MDEAVNENFIGEVLEASPNSNSPRDAGPWRHLPRGAALDMPVQDFAKPVEAVAEVRRRGYWVPRTAIFAGAAVLTGAFAQELFSILSFVVITPVQFLFLILSTIAFGWIAIGSLSAALGFLPLFTGERPDSIEPPPPTSPLASRTALLFPVYHEDPARIAGAIEAMVRELEVLGRNHYFDVFVLSDTRGDLDGGKEAAVYRALSDQLSDIAPIYYRRRMKNPGRKAGNIADWVERFGAAYESFIILDGDSVMSGGTLVSLAAAMEADDKAGLIQTVPRLVGGETLLQRLQQFACNTYGPSVAAGLAFWHRDQGNYWGHNAIIRTAAFAEAAGLPELPGRKPFGGHIMSHDFVEAVLLQRAGYGVHMMPSLEGSYEGMPPNIIDVVARDRRWAQGNLQHLAIVSQPGLTPMGRLHLGMGAASYLISGVWALSLIVGVVLALQGQQMIPSYFRDDKTLFPIWPTIDPGAALRLFMATMIVVLLPKALGLMLAWQQARKERNLFVAIRVTIGVLIETVYSMLIAPIFMVTQTVGAAEILAGRDSGWKAQKRGDGALTFDDAMWFARWQTAIGGIVGAIAWTVSPALLAWMSPVILGLVLAGPVSWLTSLRAGPLERWALATNEDRMPPPVLVDAGHRSNEWARKIATPGGLEQQPDAAAA